MVDLFGGLGLRRADLVRRLRAERFEFLLVCFGFACADIAAQSGACRDAGAFLWLNENLEIGFGIRLVADFGQQERIDVAACGDEVQIAADAGLGGMNVAEIVGPVDDPEVLVAGGEIENLLVLGKHDERRKAELGADGDNVFLRVLHDARRCVSCGARRRRRGKQHAPRTATAIPEGEGYATEYETLVSLICSFRDD